MLNVALTKTMVSRGVACIIKAVISDCLALAVYTDEFVSCFSLVGDS